MILFSIVSIISELLHGSCVIFPEPKNDWIPFAHRDPVVFPEKSHKFPRYSLTNFKTLDMFPVFPAFPVSLGKEDKKI